MSGKVFASVADVRARWIASSILPDEDIITAYLEDASTIISAEYPQLESACAGDADLANRARMVCARMVIRVLTNPDQHRQVQDTTGPFSGLVTYGTETLGGLALTQEDRALLEKTPARRVFSIAPAGFNALKGEDDPVLYREQIVNL